MCTTHVTQCVVLMRRRCVAAVICGMILGALPCAIALFPQLASIPAASVEQEFQQLTYKDGTKVETFWYNKGL